MVQKITPRVVVTDYPESSTRTVTSFDYPSFIIISNMNEPEPTYQEICDALKDVGADVSSGYYTYRQYTISNPEEQNSGANITVRFREDIHSFVKSMLAQSILQTAASNPNKLPDVNPTKFGDKIFLIMNSGSDLNEADSMVFEGVEDTTGVLLAPLEKLVEHLSSLISPPVVSETQMKAFPTRSRNTIADEYDYFGSIFNGATKSVKTSASTKMQLINA